LFSFNFGEKTYDSFHKAFKNTEYDLWIQSLKMELEINANKLIYKIEKLIRKN
jgi:hypothetical protein